MKLKGVLRPSWPSKAGKDYLKAVLKEINKQMGHHPGR